MATFGNVLTRKGGVALTGRIVTLTIPVPDPLGGLPSMDEVEALLVPVSVAKANSARAAAAEYVADTPGSSIESEGLFRLLLEALRDAVDPKVAFVELKLVNTFRDVILGKQLEYLDTEYTKLLALEYSELVSLLDLQTINSQAQAAFLPPRA